MSDQKRIPLYIAGKQPSIRVPFSIWKLMKHNEIDNNESLNKLMIRLLEAHYSTTDHNVIYTNLQAQNTNVLINQLLAQHFNSLVLH